MAKPVDDLNSEGRDALKQKAWIALSEGKPHPDLQALLERSVTPLEAHYLLRRWGVIIIYDAFNLEPSSQKVLLALADASEHFVVYDRGSSLIAVPKDLFSHERTLEDGLQTARALVREAYKREWAMEFVGLREYRSAAWVESQLLGDQYGRTPEIINYNATMQELKIYQSVALNRAMSSASPK